MAQIIELPQVNPNGGNGATDGLPTFGGVAQGAALATTPKPYPPIPLDMAPYDPSQPSMVGKVAVPGSGYTRAMPAADPNAAPMWQDMDQAKAQAVFDERMRGLARGPGWGDQFIHWTGLAGGGMEPVRQRQQAADMYGSAAGQQYMAQHPDAITHAEQDPTGFALKLGPILEAHTKGAQGTATAGQIVHSNGMAKQDDNHELTQATAQAHGTDIGAAHAVNNVAQYSWPEFYAATKNLNNYQVRQMWEMQHYLPPAQQAGAKYLTDLTNAVNTAHANKDTNAENAAQQQLERVLHLVFTNMPLQ